MYTKSRNLRSKNFFTHENNHLYDKDFKRNETNLAAETTNLNIYPNLFLRKPDNCKAKFSYFTSFQRMKKNIKVSCITL